MSNILQATGPTIVRIGFDPAEFNKLLPDQQEEFARWHFVRLLRGETTALEEWTRLGLKIDLRPWNKSE